MSMLLEGCLDNTHFKTTNRAQTLNIIASGGTEVWALWYPKDSRMLPGPSIDIESGYLLEQLA